MGISEKCLSLAAMLLYLNTAAATEPSCSEQTPENCLNGVGPAVSSLDSMRISGIRNTEQVRQEVGEETNLARHFPSRAASGLAAGDNYAGWGTWLSYNRSQFESNAPLSGAILTTASYATTQNSVMVGADRFFADRILIGVSVGYEDTDTNTAFNGGSFDTHGAMIAPYAGYLINDILSVDLLAGYAALQYDSRRLDTTDASIISGDFASHRVFFASNLNALFTPGQWVIGARLGYLYSREEQDNYVETGGAGDARRVGDRHLDLSQLTIGADMAYRFGHLEPYLSATYNNDLGRDDGNSAGGLPGEVGRIQPADDDEFLLGFGFRYFGTQGVSGNLEWNRSTGRDSFNANSLLLTLRLEL